MSLYTCVYGTFGKLLSSGATGKSLLHKKNNKKKVLQARCSCLVLSKMVCTFQGKKKNVFVTKTKHFMKKLQVPSG